MTDTALTAAIAQIEQSRAKGRPAQVRTFFDPATFTATHVVWDEATRKAAVVDSVLDFDQPSGRTSTASADRVIAFVKEAGLVVEWLLETHAHADHLSAAPYLKEQLGGTIAIGEAIRTVQGVFAKVFNEPASFAADGSQFDRLLADGEPTCRDTRNGPYTRRCPFARRRDRALCASAAHRAARRCVRRARGTCIRISTASSASRPILQGPAQILAE